MAPEIYKQLSEALQHFSALAYLIAAILLLTIALLLASYGLRNLLPQLRTYTEIVILYQFKNKENVVYFSLREIQRHVINQDPKIRELLDESFYNNLRIMLSRLRRQRTQRMYLKECLNDIKVDKEKLDKTSLEEKITRYYVDGKISGDHLLLLKDKLSEQYASMKGSTQSYSGS